MIIATKNSTFNYKTPASKLTLLYKGRLQAIFRITLTNRQIAAVFMRSVCIQSIL